MIILNRQILSPKQAQEYKERCEEMYSEEFRKGVLFKSGLNLKRPSGVETSALLFFYSIALPDNIYPPI